MGEAREYGIHFLAGGHYATETFGIRRLGELVAERFGVEHEFIDVPEPGLRSWPPQTPQFAGKWLTRRAEAIYIPPEHVGDERGEIWPFT